MLSSVQTSRWILIYFRLFFTTCDCSIIPKQELHTRFIQFQKLSLGLDTLNASVPNDTSVSKSLNDAIFSTTDTEANPPDLTNHSSKILRMRRQTEKRKLPNCVELKWPEVISGKLPPCISYKEQLRLTDLKNMLNPELQLPTLLSAPKNPTKGIRPPIILTFTKPSQSGELEAKGGEAIYDDTSRSDEDEDFSDNEFNPVTSTEEDNTLEDNFFDDSEENEEF